MRDSDNLTQKEIDEIEFNYRNLGHALTDEKMLNAIYKGISFNEICDYNDEEYDFGTFFDDYVDTNIEGEHPPIHLPDGTAYKIKEKCCKKQEIIKNKAGGLEFWVCKTCKKETDKNGNKV